MVVTLALYPVEMAVPTISSKPDAVRKLSAKGILEIGTF